MSRKRHGRIFRLWMKSHLCHWCNRPTVLIFRPPGFNGQMDVRHDEATLDHLNDRYGERPIVHGEEVTVLACSRCNNRRGHETTAALPIETLWERSGSYPQGHPKAKENRRDLRGGLEC